MKILKNLQSQEQKLCVVADKIHTPSPLLSAFEAPSPL